MCPIIKAPSTKTVKMCVKSHIERVTICGRDKITRYLRSYDPKEQPLSPEFRAPGLVPHK